MRVERSAGVPLLGPQKILSAAGLVPRRTTLYPDSRDPRRLDWRRRLAWLFFRNAYPETAGCPDVKCLGSDENDRPRYADKGLPWQLRRSHLPVPLMIVSLHSNWITVMSAAATHDVAVIWQVSRPYGGGGGGRGGEGGGGGGGGMRRIV